MKQADLVQEEISRRLNVQEGMLSVRLKALAGLDDPTRNNKSGGDFHGRVHTRERETDDRRVGVWVEAKYWIFLQ